MCLEKTTSSVPATLIGLLQLRVQSRSRGWLPIQASIQDSTRANSNRKPEPSEAYSQEPKSALHLRLLLKGSCLDWVSTSVKNSYEICKRKRTKRKKNAQMDLRMSFSTLPIKPSSNCWWKRIRNCWNRFLEPEKELSPSVKNCMEPCPRSSVGTENRNRSNRPVHESSRAPIETEPLTRKATYCFLLSCFVFPRVGAPQHYPHSVEPW